MVKSTCKHCGKEIGLWTDPWGQHREWMHAPDDGPDAYLDCHCQCAACKADTTLGIHDPTPADCIDGEVAEPLDELPNDQLPDAWLFLGNIKLYLANQKRGSRFPLMTWGDELAWIICDEKQRGVGRG